MRGVLVAALALLPAGASAEPLSLFDAHVHYSRPAWEEVSPQDVFDAFDATGVERGLVSSTPDDGTLTLHAHAPARVVPFLRPYRTRADMQTWFKDPDILEYVKGRLAQGRYVGIGEFHLYDAAHARTPEIKALSRLAVEKGLFLHVHGDAKAVRALFALEPDLRIVWAHAGMSDPAAVVGETLDAYGNLWADLSFREGDAIAPDGLDRAWEAVLIKHQDRFMFGSDTYVTERWFDYGRIVADHRKYLDLLPRAVAEKIAFANAERLFGAY